MHLRFTSNPSVRRHGSLFGALGCSVGRYEGVKGFLLVVAKLVYRIHDRLGEVSNFIESCLVE
jgi:hypothetical protein